MTTVTFGFDDLAVAGVTPSAGMIELAPAKPVLDTVTGRVLSQHEVRLRLDPEGSVSRDFDPSVAGEAVVLRVYLPGFPTGPYYVAIPNQATVSVVELLRDHQVDPGTLEPLPSYPTVGAAIDAVAQSVAQLGAELSPVAKTGLYADLDGAPTIPATPEDVGAEPAGTAAELIGSLAPVASSGSYDDLDGVPVIPSTPDAVGAEPAGLSEGTKTALSATIGAEAPGWAQGIEQREDVIRSGKGGVVGTSGRAVVAIRVDHQLDNFLIRQYPLLRARELPFGFGIVTKSVGNPTAAYEPTTATWDDLRNMLYIGGGEPWSHSQTHSNGVPLYGGTSMADEIAGSAEDLNAQTIFPMGWTQPGSPCTWGPAHNSPEAMDDAPGRLIRANYPLYEAELSNTVLRVLPSRGCRGLGHTTLDTSNYTSIKRLIDQAVALKGGVELMFHPNTVGGSGMTLAVFTQILDYLVQLRDAGTLEVLTPSALAYADPSSAHRFDLLPTNEFVNDVSSAPPILWATDTSSAAWQIGTEGETRYLAVDAAVVARIPVTDVRANGFTFQLRAKVRRAAAVTTNLRYVITNRGTSSTLVLADKTVPLTDGWQEIRRTFTIPYATTAQELTVYLDGLGGVAHVADLSCPAS